MLWQNIQLRSSLINLPLGSIGFEDTISLQKLPNGLQALFPSLQTRQPRRHWPHSSCKGQRLAPKRFPNPDSRYPLHFSQETSIFRRVRATMMCLWASLSCFLRNESLHPHLCQSPGMQTAYIVSILQCKTKIEMHLMIKQPERHFITTFSYVHLMKIKIHYFKILSSFKRGDNWPCWKKEV